MANPLSRFSWSSLLILTLTVIAISAGDSQPKQRTAVPAVLYNPKYGTHRYANVNGIRLHYVEAGDRRKPLMVFLHGFPDFWYSWRYQIPEFSKDYWTVAVDMRGFGWSDKPIGEEKYVVTTLIEDIKALIKHLKRNKFVLVGHDWGAVVASVFVATNRYMVEKYIFMAGPPKKVFKQLIDSSADQRNKSAYIIGFLQRGTAESQLQANDYAFLNPLYKGADLEVYKYIFSQPGALTAGLNYYRANISLKNGKLEISNLGNDDFNALNYSNGMFILGGKDPYISQQSLNATAEVYPRMSVRVIPSAGHFLHQDEPKITNKLIRDFLGPAKH